MFSLRLFAFALLSAVLGAGCCANDVCDPGDTLADAVKLRFSPRFAVNDLDTLTLLRRPKGSASSVRPETVTFVRGAVPLRGDSILIDNNTPFTRIANNTLASYSYEVQYLAHPPGMQKGVPTTALVIKSISIQGKYDATGCCTTYTNTTKTVSYDSLGVATTANLKEKPFLLVP